MRFLDDDVAGVIVQVLGTAGEPDETAAVLATTTEPEFGDDVDEARNVAGIFDATVRGP